MKGNFQLFSLRWQGIVDPDHYHEVFLSTSVPPRGWNRGFYADRDVDRWIEEARRTVDREKRKALYADGPAPRGRARSPTSRSTR